MATLYTLCPPPSSSFPSALLPQAPSPLPFIKYTVYKARESLAHLLTGAAGVVKLVVHVTSATTQRT